MIKLIRRNQRMFLTAVTILSMVMFVVSYRGSGAQGGGTDPQYGTILDKRVYQSDLARAKAEVGALNRYVRIELRDGRSVSVLAGAFGPDAAEVMMSKPELFLMLTQEADAAGIQVNADSANEYLINNVKELDPESDNFAITRAAYMDCEKIHERFEQITSAVKVSKPMREDYLARHEEALEMNLVQLSAADYMDKVPAPTTQQVQEQFSKFAGNPPHTASAGNPFCFGYELPMRAKLQYLRVSTDAILTAVVASKSTYDWEVAARKYYLNNAGEFAIQPPASGPSTEPSTQPAIPQTFEQARDRVLKTIRQPLVDALLGQVRDYLRSTLNTDYQAYVQYCTSGKGGSEDSSLGVRYSSFSYISRLIDTVQERFKVNIVGSESPDYLSMQDIEKISGVGSADVAHFAQTQAEAYLDKVARKDPTAEAVLVKPSPFLTNSDGKTTFSAGVFVRLSAVLPAQPPADVSGVQSQAESDVRLTEAYKLALDQAASLQTAAERGNLAIAAAAIARPVIPVQGDDAISIDTTDIKGVVPALDDSAKSFTAQAFDLLGSYEPRTDAHPVKTIELPEQGRLFVAQLTAVKPDWNGETYYAETISANGQARRDQDFKLITEWFDYDAVVKRVDFKAMK